MKNLLIATALLAATFSTSASTFTTTPDVSLPDYMVLTSRAYAGKGMSPTDVETTLGAASAKLSNDVWVYWDFKATNVPAAHHFDTLVVVFSKGRVTTLRLCDSKPVRAFVAQQQKRKSTEKALAE